MNENRGKIKRCYESLFLSLPLPLFDFFHSCTEFNKQKYRENVTENKRKIERERTWDRT